MTKQLLEWNAPLLALALFACAPQTTKWVALADGFEPGMVGSGEEIAVRGEVRFVGAEDSGIWVEKRYAGSQLGPGPFANMRALKRAIGQVGAPRDGGSPTQLWVDGVALEWVDPTQGAMAPEALSAGQFSALGDSVVWVEEAGAKEPKELLLRSYVTRGAANGEVWNARLDGTAGAGFVLVPGLSEVVVLKQAGAAELLFTVGSQRHAEPGSNRLAAPELRVWLDRERIACFELKPGDVAALERCQVALPPGKGGRRLRFELEGSQEVAAVFEPRLRFGPKTKSKQARRDVVIFVADTFRADNLSCYRGSPGGQDLGNTPNLDHFAQTALCYRAAWAPSSWTLPSHASLFTSLYPPQHGAGFHELYLALEALTLAESLRAAGYRTFAATDGGFCGEVYGLAQGFDVWTQGKRGLERGLQDLEAFLSDDDGRPRFIFLQTYTTHEPYAPSAAARIQLAPKLAVLGTWEEQHGALLAAAEPWLRSGRDPALHGALEAPIKALSALYAGTVADLDRGFAELEGLLDQHGFDRKQMILLFTSDHGEALGEHDFVGHTEDVWEEQTRIPLLLRGRGFEPGSVETPVSLVDVAPSLLHALELPVPKAWFGRVCSPAPANTADIFLYSKRAAHRQREEARVRGTQKTIYNVDGARTLQFDLAGDPKELAPTLLAVPFESLGTDLARVLAPNAAQGLDPATHAQLIQLGYKYLLENPAVPPNSTEARTPENTTTPGGAAQPEDEQPRQEL